jgi:hypothetical protein
MKMNKPDRYDWYTRRALTSMRRFTREYGIAFTQKAAEKDLMENG